MEVPTILAPGQLQGDVSTARSNPDQFGAGIGESLGVFGNSTQRTANMVADHADQRKQLQDAEWVNTSMNQERQYQDEWHANPENNSTTTYASDYKKLATERYALYANKAPSARARAMFSEQYNNYLSSRYAAALQTTAKNQLDKSILDTSGAGDQLMASYRSMRNTPNLDAHTEFLKGLATYHANIDQMFGKIAPGVADKLHEQADINAVYATAPYDQNLAHKILDSGKIDGRTYHVLSDMIDQEMNSRNVAETTQFESYRKNWIDSVASGKNGDKIPISTYELYYPAPQANAHKSMDDAQIDVFNDVNGFMSKVESYSPVEQQRMLADKVNKVGDNVDTASRDTDVARILHQRIMGDGGTIAQATRDPAGYLMNHNPAVKQAIQKLTDSPEESPGRNDLMTQANSLILKYQGPPPRNPDGSLAVSEDEAKQYHNIPRDRVSILSAQQAETYANQVNHSSPKDVLKTLAQLHQQFPDPQQWAIAFNDMVKLPGSKGIRGEYQLAALNMNDDGTPKNQYVDDFVGVLQSADDIRKASSDKLADFEKELDSNPTWQTYLKVLPNDNFQDQNTAAEFKNGLLLYAMGIAQRGGTSATPAVKTAIGRLLESQLHVTSINGTPQVISRDRGVSPTGFKLQDRSDADIQRIGERLQESILTIDPREISLIDEHGYPHFPELSAIGNEMTKYSKVRDALKTYGTFKMTPDGQSAVLYFDDGKNVPFEVRDKGGRALVANIKDVENSTLFDTHAIDLMGILPRQHSSEYEASIQSGVRKIPANERSMLNMKLAEKYDVYRHPENSVNVPWVGESQTNWPTLAPFIKRQGETSADAVRRYMEANPEIM